jgi:predicted Zn-dependent protease
MRARFAEIFEQATAAARALGVGDLEAIFSCESAALTRFANNTIHQNVAERTCHLSVRPVIGGRTARASTNRLDREGIRRVVGDAVDLTRLTEPDPELPPLVGPGLIEPVGRYFETTAGTTPQMRAESVAEAIAVVEGSGQIAAGIYSTGETFFGLRNTLGVDAWHEETLARFSITAMAPDSSGWAKDSACDCRKLDPAGLARAAASKASASANPRVVPAGRYTVVLEPAAVLDLAGQMFGDFSATAIRDGRSFLNDRLGRRLFGSNVTIHDDARHPQQSGAPFDGEGVRRQSLTLVENGVVRDIAYCRQAAALAGTAPTGHGFPVPNEIGEAPVNIVIAGGETPVEEMIRSTEHGILLTRLWYIREVDPYEKIFTGMTRDGTFLIERGEIAGGVRNFRFNVGLMEMLSKVEALSPTARGSGEEAMDMVVPAMKVADFNFTEVTRF